MILETFLKMQMFFLMILNMNFWKPNYSFQFPTTVICDKKRKFNVKWLEDFLWFAYSSNVDGAFCRPCVLFGRRVGVNASKLDRLMRAPLVNWSSAIQRFRDHGQNSEIHKNAAVTMFEFKQIMKGKRKSILEMQGQIVDGNGRIQERFVKFIYCNTGTSGKALTDKIISSLRDHFNLDIMQCRCQCYDGAGNMAGKYSGVAARILEENRLALYTHCASHRLSLCVASACKIQNVKNMTDNVGKISNFFNNSPKRQALLEEMVKQHLPHYSHTKLIDPC